MFQRTCKKISIDFFNHGIPNDEHWCFIDFWRLVGFWDSGGGLSFFLSGGRLSLFITWLILFRFEDVTSLLIKCVVSSRCAWLFNSLSICICFTLLFCFANFVNWRSLSDWMEFDVVDIQIWRRSSFFFQKCCRASDFYMNCYFWAVWAVFWWHCFFLLHPPLKGQFDF